MLRKQVSSCVLQFVALLQVLDLLSVRFRSHDVIMSDITFNPIPTLRVGESANITWTLAGDPFSFSIWAQLNTSFDFTTEKPLQVL